MHPFVPVEQASGYQEIFRDLERMLCDITGFAAVSLQPNSGAQGELAGLMVIRAYHRARGDSHRTVALIPSSAHGTNPASAVMAGMKVVVVACDTNGNVDLGDLRAKAEQHKDTLAALMVTYPSTHGVYEDAIREICEIVHAHGGQVYMDGANMNAQVGLTSPALIGADVCHLNLHKTFAIPHGGGGPGMGPIGVARHLAPYLPSHPLVPTGGGASGIHAISAAPWGSALILLISYAYMSMLGGDGMTEATRYAILNANYIKARLEGPYTVLYTGRDGRVAHELILDLRPLKQASGIDEMDVAKRLMDYGFHAPTVSFPVPGTLMIEPTESEARDELDRFCDAMLAIRAEIQAVIDGTVDAKDNVLKHAPHTAAVVMADEWTRPYPRSLAAFPLPYLRTQKVWPAVGRIDNPFGDRHLVCACPPMTEYAEEPVGRVGRNFANSERRHVDSSARSLTLMSTVELRNLKVEPRLRQPLRHGGRERVHQLTGHVPGAAIANRAWLPMRTTGTISRVVLVRKASCTDVRSSSTSTHSSVRRPDAAASSSTNPRVTPTSSPASTGGVSSTPSRTKKMLDCAHSHNSPRWFFISASKAPSR